jgi:hypothetical protein
VCLLIAAVEKHENKDRQVNRFVTNESDACVTRHWFSLVARAQVNSLND